MVHADPYLRFDSLVAAGAGALLTYGAYVARAFRWSVFLRPTKPATPAQMVPAQFIGFTSVAILGRLGEFVRPYLVARRQQVTFTSQLAVYAVNAFSICWPPPASSR